MPAHPSLPVSCAISVGTAAVVQVAGTRRSGITDALARPRRSGLLGGAPGGTILRAALTNLYATGVPALRLMARHGA